MTITDVRRIYERKRGEQDHARTRLQVAQRQLKLEQERKERIEEAQMLIQAVAQQTQQALEYRLGELVTLALDALWPNEGWQFRVLFELRRGRTEADLIFEDQEGHRIDPMSADGGGAVDVAALALRIALWSLRRPRSQAVIVLDEPFRCLSTDLQERACQLLRELKERLHLQFIIVTHEEELLNAADKMFRVKRVAGISKVLTQST